MIMFQVEKVGKNSFAVGFCEDIEKPIDNKEAKRIFSETKKETEYFSKGFTSRIDKVQQIIYPPKAQQYGGLLEASFSVGNSQQCVGELTLKYVPKQK